MAAHERSEMQRRRRTAAEDTDDGGGGDCWPASENVLRSLREHVRPAAVARDDDRVAADVRSCLTERVTPYGSRGRRQDAGPATDGPPRPSWRRRRRRARPDVEAVVAAAARNQTRAMAVRSAYADGKYYASDAAHASRTVEELSLEAGPEPYVGRGNCAYTAGTVLYDRDTGACHLHGLTDPRRRVAVDCGRLTGRLPRHRSTVKMFSEVRRAPDDGPPVLVPHHFQVFRPRRDDDDGRAFFRAASSADCGVDVVDVRTET